MPLIMGVDNTDKSNRTKATKRRIVRGVAGRNMAVDVVLFPRMPSTWMFSLVVGVDSKMSPSRDPLSCRASRTHHDPVNVFEIAF